MAPVTSVIGCSDVEYILSYNFMVLGILKDSCFIHLPPQIINKKTHTQITTERIFFFKIISSFYCNNITQRTCYYSQPFVYFQRTFYFKHSILVHIAQNCLLGISSHHPLKRIKCFIIFSQDSLSDILGYSSIPQNLYYAVTHSLSQHSKV